MIKKFECNKCAFYHKGGYQDMGAHSDVCKANPDMWDAIMESDVPKEHCKYAVNIKNALKEAREAWTREKEEKE